MEISVFLIIHLPKYHFLHQTKDNPSFDYFDVLVFGIVVKYISKMKNLNLKMNLNFLTPVEVSDDYTRLG